MMKSFLFFPLTLLAVLATSGIAQAQGIDSQTSFGSLGDVLVAFFEILIRFIPGIAIIYLAISGYRYMTAQGNPDMVEKAKKSLTYAIVGVIVAFSSVLIIELFAKQLGFKTGFIL